MGNIRRAFGAVTASGLFLLGTAVVADTAAAAPLACGTVITKSTTLTDDMNCTTGPALIVQGKGIVLKLNGHTISGFLVTRTVNQTVDGVPMTYDVKYSGVPGIGNPSDGAAGIRVSGSGNKVLGPGTVRWFAAGVLLLNSDKNTVSGLTVDENIGPAGTGFLGDGIVAMNADGNTISNNTISNNGPYSGVTFLGDADNNTLSGNAVTTNNHAQLCGSPAGCSGGSVPQYAITFNQNMGVRYEGDGPNGEGANGNKVLSNTITDSGNTGIFFGTYCHFDPTPIPCDDPAAQGKDGNINNTASANTVNGNGFGYRVNGQPVGPPNATMFGGQDDGGSGILLFTVPPNPPAFETITGNTVNGNARHGIDLGDGKSNTVVNNKASGNNAAPLPDPCPGSDCAGSFNGRDANLTPPCDSNTWMRNAFGSIVSYEPNLAGDASVNQPCVSGSRGSGGGGGGPALSANAFRRGAASIDGSSVAVQ